MKIGVPKEIKPQENRIGLTPESVKTLVSEGHEVIVENNGGFEAGFENEQYTSVGAKIAKVRLSFILAGWYSPETVSTPNSFKSVTILASNKVFPEPALPIIATSLFFF